MKTLYLLFLTCLCFGCSSHSRSLLAPIQPPVAVTSTVDVATPAKTPSELSTAIGSTYTANSIDAKLGIITLTNEERGCLRVLNATLKPNDVFYVIAAYEKPHEIHRLRIMEKLAKSCVDDDSDSGDDDEVLSRTSYYFAELVQSDAKYPEWWSNIAVVGVSRPPTLENGVASIELNGTSPAEYFRECTSNEGVHMTVWSGTPLMGKRLWHRYFYLHYDTVPNCKKKDYE